MRTTDKERMSQRPQPRNRFNGLFKTIKVLLLLFSLLLGTGLGFLWVSSPTIRKTTSIIIHRDYRPAKAFPGKSEITLLLLGKDCDRNRRGEVVNTRARSDTIILARLDFASNKASLLSIPRDTRVRIPGYRGKHKINAAHAFGGPELASETISDLLGVRPDAYVVADYDGFVRVIDYVGGLDVKVDKQLDYDDNWGHLHIHLKPGQQHLDGYQAMGFVRYRKSNDGHGDSDLVRIARQQEFLRAAKQKIASPSTFFKLPTVLEMTNKDIVGSLTQEQMCAVAFFLRTLPPASIQMETLPAETGRVAVTVDDDATRELVQRMFFQ